MALVAPDLCRFGRSCQRPDCKYGHPSGRRIDEDERCRATSVFKIPKRCKFDHNCRKLNCWFVHPHGRAIDAERKQSPKESRKERRYKKHASDPQSQGTCPSSQPNQGQSGEMLLNPTTNGTNGPAKENSMVELGWLASEKSDHGLELADRPPTHLLDIPQSPQTTHEL